MSDVIHLLGPITEKTEEKYDIYRLTPLNLDTKSTISNFAPVEARNAFC